MRGAISPSSNRSPRGEDHLRIQQSPAKRTQNHPMAGHDPTRHETAYDASATSIHDRRQRAKTDYDSTPWAICSHVKRGADQITTLTNNLRRSSHPPMEIAGRPAHTTTYGLRRRSAPPDCRRPAQPYDHVATTPDDIALTPRRHSAFVTTDTFTLRGLLDFSVDADAPRARKSDR